MTKRACTFVRFLFPFLAGAILGLMISIAIQGLPSGAADGQCTLEGDVNRDGAVNLGDPVYLLQYLFGSGTPPRPCDGPVQPRLVFIVRHAEKETTGADPGLTPEGQARAQRLADVFSRQGLAAIYASEKRRTYDTVLPLATAKGMEIIRFDQINDMAGMVHTLKDLPAGAVVVVAAHSYTIDELLTDIGIPTPGDLPTTIYDDLFLVTLPVEGAPPPLSVNLRYW